MRKLVRSGIAVAATLATLAQAEDSIPGNGVPAWQPQGQNLVAPIGLGDGPRHLVLLNRDGAPMGALPRSSGFSSPAWEPGGRRIYALNPALQQAVGRWNADGSEPTLVPLRGLADGGQRMRAIVFNPSGRRVAILTDAAPGIRVAQVGDDGWNVTPAAAPPFAALSRPLWLDDDRLLFVGRAAAGRRQLLELDLSRGSLRAVAREGLSPEELIALSDDHQWVVVTAAGAGRPAPAGFWKIALASGHALPLNYADAGR